MYNFEYDVVQRNRRGDLISKFHVRKSVDTKEELNREFYLYLACYENENWTGDIPD